MSDVGTKFSQNQKIVLYGITTAAAAIFTYFVYLKFVKHPRSGSSSSDSGEDTALIHQIKKANLSPQKAKSTQRKKETDIQQSQNGHLLKKKNSGFDHIRNGQKYNSSSMAVMHHKMPNSKKVIYFDSNDEMFCEDEVSEDELTEQYTNQNGNKHKKYTKVLLNPSEEEKRKIRELVGRQKKRHIQEFLQDVNEKRGTFLHQKKRTFKEDNMANILNGKADKSLGSRTQSTQSDDKQNHINGLQFPPASLQNINGNSQQLNKIRQEQIVKQHNKQMAAYYNQSSKNQDKHAQQTINNGYKSSQVVELSPHHFRNKERVRWFDLFSMYTNNFMQDGQENEKFRKRQQLEKYYSGMSSKKRSASVE